MLVFVLWGLERKGQISKHSVRSLHTTPGGRGWGVRVNGERGWGGILAGLEKDSSKPTEGKMMTNANEAALLLFVLHS